MGASGWGGAGSQFFGCWVQGIGGSPFGVDHYFAGKGGMSCWGIKTWNLNS